MNSTSVPAELQQLILLKHSTFLIDAFSFFSASLVVYDHFLTFGREVKEVWFAQWNYGKILFLLTRYIIYVDMAVLFTIDYIKTSDQNLCRKLGTAIICLELIGIVLTEVVLILRTWALWGCKKSVLAFLVAIYSVVIVVEGILLSGYIRSYVFQLGLLPLCYASAANLNLLVGVFASVAAFESVILIMTAYRAIDTSRYSTSRLSKILYRDGALYYLCITTISVANLILLKTAPPAFGNTLITPQRTLHAVCSCRIILNMVEALRRPGLGIVTSVTFTELPSDSPIFAPRPRHQYELSNLKDNPGFEEEYM